MKPPDLNEMRTSLDNLDAALLFLLAERFRVTRKIGLYKSEHDLPAVDNEREANLLARVEELARERGLDVSFTKKVFRCIIDEVVKDHQALLNSR